MTVGGSKLVALAATIEGNSGVDKRQQSQLGAPSSIEHGWQQPFVAVRLASAVHTDAATSESKTAVAANLIGLSIRRTN